MVDVYILIVWVLWMKVQSAKFLPVFKFNSKVFHLTSFAQVNLLTTVSAVSPVTMLGSQLVCQRDFCFMDGHDASGVLAIS